MNIDEIAVTSVALVPPDTPCREVAATVSRQERCCAAVEDPPGEVGGVACADDLVSGVFGDGPAGETPVAEVMTPVSRLIALPGGTNCEAALAAMVHQDARVALLEDEGTFQGVVFLEDLWRVDGTVRPNDIESDDARARMIVDALHEGVVMVDRDLTIREFNPAAEKLTGYAAAERVGQKAKEISEGDSPIFQVLQTGEPIFGEEVRLQDGRVWLCNFVPVMREGAVTGAIQTFRDVTSQKQLREDLWHAREELDTAFALTLPNSQVEHKLKTTPEYIDEHNPETGLVEITDIIEDGNYRHVINALKVAAELHRKGAMKLVGIRKDTLVQAIIFHDIGKSQPDLEIGDVVEPAEVFETGSGHARRSASLAEKFYQLPLEVVQVIRHHHDTEEQLEKSGFPEYLRPMLRLFRVVDGVSAGITRRQGTAALECDGPVVTVHERNNHPTYSRSWSINLLTGRQRDVEAPEELDDTIYRVRNHFRQRRGQA